MKIKLSFVLFLVFNTLFSFGQEEAIAYKGALIYTINGGRNHVTKRQQN